MMKKASAAPPHKEEPKSAKAKVNLAHLKFNTNVKVVVHAAEVPEEMIHNAVLLADEAMRQNMNDGDFAMHIKKRFDSSHKPTWHCIVGRRFSSLVTHEEGSFLHFYMGKLAIILFKCKD
uniref:Dynein light chain n=1 Tax=Steinernema glaseri TaxID=37863 RepID=A0A1I7Z076_9BILA